MIKLTCGKASMAAWATARNINLFSFFLLYNLKQKAILSSTLFVERREHFNLHFLK